MSECGPKETERRALAQAPVSSVHVGHILPSLKSPFALPFSPTPPPFLPSFLPSLLRYFLASFAPWGFNLRSPRFRRVSRGSHGQVFFNLVRSSSRAFKILANDVRNQSSALQLQENMNRGVILALLLGIVIGQGEQKNWQIWLKFVTIIARVF